MKQISVIYAKYVDEISMEQLIMFPFTPRGVENVHRPSFTALRGVKWWPLLSLPPTYIVARPAPDNYESLSVTCTQLSCFLLRAPAREIVM